MRRILIKCKTKYVEYVATLEGTEISQSAKSPELAVATLITNNEDIFGVAIEWERTDAIIG